MQLIAAHQAAAAVDRRCRDRDGRQPVDAAVRHAVQPLRRRALPFHRGRCLHHRPASPVRGCELGGAPRRHHRRDEQLRHREAVERNNAEATRSVAEACADTGTALIHASTTSVYGPQDERVDEECSPRDLNPPSPYAETKLREEELIAGLGRSAGLRAITCRFGTIFGTSPGMRFHTAVNKFCWQAVMGVPLTVWKTAYDQRRPYLDLGDAVRAVAFIIERGLFDGRVYNVVTANATVCDVVNCIRTHVPEVHVEFVETEIMNQLSYDVANTRMTRAGFEVRGDLGKGVAETIALLKNANAG